MVLLGVPYVKWWMDNWNNYEGMRKASSLGIPVFSQLTGGRADYLAYEENIRYWRDFAKNTGVDSRNWKYPIRMGVYGTPTYGINVGSVSSAIMGLYKPLKPINKTVNIENFGDYYRYKNYYHR